MFQRTRLALLLFATAAMTNTALASPREDMLAGISRCAAIPDDRTFLDCVYGAAQPIRARLGLPPAPAAQQRLVPPAMTSQALPLGAAAAPQAGGVIGLFKDSGLQMASYSFDKRGLFTVTLSDGTVWRQDANDTNFAHFSARASDYPVTLIPGAYGKSRLDVRGEAGSYVVERVR